MLTATFNLIAHFLSEDSFKAKLLNDQECVD